jgi:hypothetical protein
MVKNSQCPKINFRRGVLNVKKKPILSKIQTAMVPIMAQLGSGNVFSQGETNATLVYFAPGNRFSWPKGGALFAPESAGA